MNCNTTHYRANSSSVPGDPTPRLTGWLGTLGYDAAVSLGVGLNAVFRCLGLRPVSLAELCKSKVPAARRHIARFEDCCLRAAAARGYDTVIAGHIHVPCQRSMQVGGREVTYLNSGDWVDSLSALEYTAGAWRLVTWAGLLASGQVQSTGLDDTVVVQTPSAA